MRLEALRAILWVRWRVLGNRLRKTGAVGQALYAVLLVFGVAAAITCFAGALVLGVVNLPEANPRDAMMAWIGLSVAFLFFWLVGVVSDLQRGDSMSFSNLLHLPVSLPWVFVCNYLGSFVNLSSILFVPAMLGLAAAMIVVYGAGMVVVLWLVAAFFLMLTAFSYQLRGWLGRLMENKRRGRNVVALVTLGFVLLVQVPNFLNMTRDHSWSALDEETTTESPGQVSESQRNNPLARYQALREKRAAANDRFVQRICRVVPLGWLPFGVRSALDGRWLAAYGSGLGMLALGVWSLRSSFLGTLRGVMRGEKSKVQLARVRAAASAEANSKVRELLVGRRLPLVSEGVQAVLLANLRSVLRAPEAKIVLLSPILLLCLGAISLRSSGPNLVPEAGRPYLSLGAVLIGMLSIMQLSQNQFGLDRAGFRAYVLSPLPRHAILAGKNLSFAPFGLGVGLASLALLRIFVPLSVEALLCGVLQLGTGFLLLSLVANWISILGPMRLHKQGLRVADMKVQAFLWQVLSMVLYPVVLTPLIVPIALAQYAQLEGIPLALLLNGVVFGLALWLYRVLIRRQGVMLQAREQKILETLTRR